METTGNCAIALHAVDPEFLHKGRQGWPQNQLPILRLDSLGTNPCQKQAREVPERELVVSAGNHDELVRAILALVLLPVPRIGAGQRAER